MTEPILRAAAEVRPPLRGAVYANATSTTTAYLDLDQAITDPETGKSTAKFLRGRYLTIQALTADLYYVLQANNSDTITPTAAAGDFAAANCAAISAGSAVQVWIPKTPNTRYLAFRTASGAGGVRAWPSSPVGQ
jgi:hypothetical protein